MPFIPHFVPRPPAAPVTVDPARTRLVQELRQRTPLLGCRFDPSGRFVFAGGQDNTVQRWELATGRRLAYTGHRSWIRALAFQGGRLFSGDYNGQIFFWPVNDPAWNGGVGTRHSWVRAFADSWQWDARPPAPSQIIDAHRGWVRALAVSPDGRRLASCGNDNLVKLWSTADGTLVRALEGHEHHVYNVAFHPTGEHLVSADLHGVIRHWSVASGTQTRTLDCSILFRYDPTFRADHGGIRAMTFNREGTTLACTGITNVTNAFAGIGNPAVVLFDWQTGNRTQILRPQPAFQGTGWGVVYHPAGFVAAAGGGNGGALWFWRPSQANSFHTVALPTNARDLDLHPDGRRLAIAFADGAVRIYDMVPG
jgi:WD40 repeat protein